MWYGRMPKPKSRLVYYLTPYPHAWVPYTSPLSITYQLSRGQFIVRHIRPYYGSMLP